MSAEPDKTRSPHGDPIAALLSAIRPWAVSVVREAMSARADGPTHYSSAAPPPGVTSRAFLDACRSGDLAASRIGRRWIATNAAVAAWIESRRAATTEPTPADASGYERSLALVMRKVTR